MRHRELAGDRKLAGLLRDIVDLKDAGHYGLANVRPRRAKSVVRKATALIEAARNSVTL